MFQKLDKEKLKKNKVAIFSALFVLMIMITTFIASSYLYFTSGNTFQKIPLYFPDATSSIDSTYYKPEMRTIPKMKYNFIEKNDNISNVKIFLEELILGPNSIYMKNFIPQHVDFSNILAGSYQNSKDIFIKLQNNDKNRDLTKLEVTAIRNWLQYNIDIYFYSYNIYILL